MLFDLRARGRRRTVKIVYTGLAILFGFSFIGFGVGTGGSFGGLFEGIFGNKEGGASAGFAAQISTAEKSTQKKPNEAAAWASLAEALYHEASTSEYFDESTGKFTEKGKQLLAKVAKSWNRYVALKPSKLNLTVAQQMVTVYGQEGLNEPTAAVEALQLIIPERPPTAALYGELAQYAYLAKNTREGELASRKTISLTPAADRAKVEAELTRIKKNPTGNPSNETYTTTTNGKTYNVKVGANGTGTGTEAKSTTPAPAKTK
jgi:predicted Zn-dependent protease